MFKMSTAVVALLVAGLVGLACSNGSGPSPGGSTAGTGGATKGGQAGGGVTGGSGGMIGVGGVGAGGTGGTTATGGTTGAGGMTGAGGTVSTGGTKPIAGTTAAGGTAGTGGTIGTGGTVSTGGTKPIGGTTAAGGTTGTGGTIGTGGTVSTGGTKPIGGTTIATAGATNTGGGTGTAGATGTGGTSSIGGTPSSGGVKATGGAPATGGSSAGSTSVIPTCQADCTGKTCGDDGCNGTCGGCPPSQLCGASNTCQPPTGTTGIVVDAASQLTAISPAIYGVAVNSDDSMAIAGLNRWGGDSTGSYNWKNDIFNSGVDWYCANYKGFFTSPSPSPTLTNSADQFVFYNISKHVDTLMTIPLTGWLGNVVTSTTANANCNWPGAATCCTDIGTSESILVDKGSAVLDTSYMESWVAHLASTFGAAANGGVKYYQLDNEPDNWQSLRPDIYPSLYPPGTWCESYYNTITQIGTSINQDFINRTMAYAAAIKAADPTSNVLFMSTENSDDLVALPNIECGNPAGPYTLNNSLTAAILTLGAQHEATTHQRILDCVDLHYPLTGSGLNATKALWDSTSSSVFPHIQGWINAKYPGTGVCVSEYNVSNDGTNGSTPGATSGTLEADVLGMFGRLGIRVASYWTTLVSGNTHLPIYNAMAMYRNYDGLGGRFGSYAVGAASPNAGVNVYASTDSPVSPTKLWVMLVNVSGANQTNLSITLNNFTPSGSAQVYQMVGGAAPAAAPAATITSGVISGLSLSSGSVALLAMSK